MVNRATGSGNSVGRQVIKHCRHGSCRKLPGPASAAGSIPIIAVEAAVLDGFGDVLGGNRLTATEIGYGARHFEDAVVRACGQTHAAHRHLVRSPESSSAQCLRIMRVGMRALS